MACVQVCGINMKLLRELSVFLQLAHNPGHSFSVQSNMLLMLPPGTLVLQVCKLWLCKKAYIFDADQQYVKNFLQLAQTPFTLLS